MERKSRGSENGNKRKIEENKRKNWRLQEFLKNSKNEKEN